MGGTYLGVPTLPPSWPGQGVTTLDGGTYLGVPPLHLPPPHPDLARGGGNYLGQGVPTLVYPLLLWTDRLLAVKTLTFRRTTYAGCKNVFWDCKWILNQAWVVFVHLIGRKFLHFEKKSRLVTSRHRNRGSGTDLASGSCWSSCSPWIIRFIGSFTLGSASSSACSSGSSNPYTSSFVRRYSLTPNRSNSAPVVFTSCSV